MERRTAGFRRRCGSGLIKIFTLSLTRRSWSNLSNIPREGGCIIAVNHVSEFDPLVVWHCLRDAGRWPRFLTKASLLEAPILGPFLYLVGCIPVYRGTADAASVLDAAADAVQAGDCVVIYPEGTTPKEGDLWPRRGKTGVARLFLATAAPVVPLVTWGPQNVLDPRTRKWHLRSRTSVTAVAGRPIDLSRWADTEPTATNLNAITEQVMAALHVLLAELRDTADQ
ncbi:1-acyl-sn-glycerol-3-phosphate acyltransferase [Streptomyces sp. NBC_01136]|uniref:lysophospholipid acyltransferase family protein n=1 Tax=unclassified Streptomyces TaxID=2593676 RepID=UPI00324E115A|nr:1-acyl-sn-glycerol-3-phosphate acyltransferase [Streptomyces sp. NBC_01136]